jgi:uncharacterized coiled-coil protein SlyX
MNKKPMFVTIVNKDKKRGNVQKKISNNNIIIQMNENKIIKQIKTLNEIKPNSNNKELQVIKSDIKKQQLEVKIIKLQIQLDEKDQIINNLSTKLEESVKEIEKNEFEIETCKKKIDLFGQLNYFLVTESDVMFLLESINNVINSEAYIKLKEKIWYDKVKGKLILNKEIETKF